MRKLVVIHLGPHKTGSTAIQAGLQKNKQALKELGVNVWMNEQSHQIAKNMVNANYVAAESQLVRCIDELNKEQSNYVIMSHEDLSGGLIGRNKGRKIYPRLTKHLRILNRAFYGWDKRFVFFVRDKPSWLESCYIQNIKYRTDFSNLDDFIARYDEDWDWKCSAHV
jgi:hypothetical protein